MHLAEQVSRCFPCGGPLRALLLGVTPELAVIPWQRPCELVAVDESEAMIARVWPGDAPHRRAIRGSWFDLPVSPHSLDCVMGDGCFTVIDYPDGYRKLAASLARVLVSGGLFSVRLFCRPARPERLEDVFEALEAGRIGNFHAFKWRLAMALHRDDIARGVAVADVWTAFHERVHDRAALARRLAWPLAEVETIDNYRGANARYTYPTVEEVVAVLAAEFELLNEWRGRYELAERCPQLLFCRH
jgi:SAM-dependent methyltransferase